MRTWAEISKSRLAENYRAIRDGVGPGVTVACVVKANAYGHGAVPVSRLLVEEGASWLAVSTVAEGAELRAAGIGVRILVMGGVLACEREALIQADLTPAVHSLDDLRQLDALGIPLRVHLKIDTGMARLGVRASLSEIEDAVRGLRNIQVEGVMSHLASPEDAIQTGEQLVRFGEALEGLRPEIGHVASSYALGGGSRGNMVRPGIALYGYAPVFCVKPVLCWKARVVAVKDLPAGAPVGYGARYHAPRAMKVAVLAAGYADGVPRALTNCGAVAFETGLAPIVGAVSMDLTTVDVTGLPTPRPGDVAEIAGDRVTAADIARLTGTISYEILTGIGARVTRVYV